MTQSEPTRPLVGASSQETIVDVGTPTVVRPSPTSTRAYKVAGFTLLACLLIAGQAVTAYFLLRQGNDITSLEKQTDSLKGQMANSRSASVPMKMHMPMNPMPKLVDLDDEDTSAPLSGTQCQLETLGLAPVKLPSFRPACDEAGNYMPQQCWMDLCWCVDASGMEIEGSKKHGKAFCDISSGMKHGQEFTDSHGAVGYGGRKVIRKYPASTPVQTLAVST